MVACQYGFSYEGTYFQLQEGYEPACEHWSVGIGLRAWSIRQFLNEGVREFCLVGDMGRLDTDWGAETKLSKRITLSRASCKNILFSRGREWWELLSESVRNIFPEKVLTARRVPLEEQSSAGFRLNHNGQGAATPFREWMRDVASRCYFHFQLPRLTRSIRSRYQLAVSSNGKWPKISCSRRMETAARILCFHRVNDDNDPFFPRNTDGIVLNKKCGSWPNTTK